MSAVLPITKDNSTAARRRPAGTGVIVEVRNDLPALRAMIPDWEALAAEAGEVVDVDAWKSYSNRRYHERYGDDEEEVVGLGEGDRA